MRQAAAAGGQGRVGRCYASRGCTQPCFLCHCLYFSLRLGGIAYVCVCGVCVRRGGTGALKRQASQHTGQVCSQRGESRIKGQACIQHEVHGRSGPQVPTWHVCAVVDVAPHLAVVACRGRQGGRAPEAIATCASNNCRQRAGA
jgi:hypothetical protein